MSGHSKFANIKHKKEKNDASRGKVFTKLGRELVVAIKEGGADPNGNSKLRDVISKCKAANMPNDTIERGYGPAGIAIMVDCLTDNHNRTASDVRYAFSRNGGNLGTTGCVSFMFDKKGQITAEMPEEGADEEEIMMTALDAGAEDVEIEDGEILVTTDPNTVSDVREALEKAGWNITGAEVSEVPQNTVSNDDPEVAATMERLIDALEDLDDVQNVYHNWE